MSRPRRRRLHHYAHILSQLKPRFIGETLVPGELAVFVPDEEALCYVNDRKVLHHLALQYLPAEPTVTHAVFTLDILGGIHDVRLHDDHERLELEEIARMHTGALCDFPLPTGLVYVERSDAPRHIGPARWQQLENLHRHQLFLTDVLIVAPADRIVWSAAEHYGPDPFAPEIAEERRLDVQAARVRERLGIDTLSHKRAS